MTLNALRLDPELYRDFGEPPYRPGRDYLCAPVEPFAVAVDEWLHRYRARVGADRFAGITLRNGRKPTQLQDRGIGELAGLTGIPARTIRRYVDREQKFIALQNADRLAIALDIPLILLADEFRTMRRWQT
jgi:hypothetical protein